jgi:hypothetical protein
MNRCDISDVIIDASEYGIGPRWHIGGRRHDRVAAVLGCPDHLVGFARAEVRDRVGSGVDIVTKAAR